jgi:hypothetical protein
LGGAAPPDACGFEQQVRVAVRVAQPEAAPPTSTLTSPFTNALEVTQTLPRMNTLPSTMALPAVWWSRQGRVAGVCRVKLLGLRHARRNGCRACKSQEHNAGGGGAAPMLANNGSGLLSSAPRACACTRKTPLVWGALSPDCKRGIRTPFPTSPPCHPRTCSSYPHPQEMKTHP